MRALSQHVPPEYGRYFEPFAGAAALFFHLEPRDAVLADNNHELMNFYRVLRDNPLGMHDCLKNLPVTETHYRAMRAADPVNPVERAARFKYLVTLAFNGIYRVNQDGRFNTPYGKREYSFDDGEELLAMSRALAGVELLTCDFEDAIRPARAGDFIYFDPPYTVSHNNGSFIRYNEHLYSFDDQRRLARVARQLANAGCSVLVSNAWHPSILELYEGFEIEILERSSLIAAAPGHRRPVQEVLISANTH